MRRQAGRLCDGERGFFHAGCRAHYLHLDCLFVREGWRNRAIGRQLWQALHDFALALDCRQMQWQTPEWNTGAARFYLRLGACELRKRRYVLALDATMPPPPRR
jgi:GNAT superfamily N-acetyltransferase